LCWNCLFIDLIVHLRLSAKQQPNTPLAGLRRLGAKWQNHKKIDFKTLFNNWSPPCLQIDDDITITIDHLVIWPCIQLHFVVIQAFIVAPSTLRMSSTFLNKKLNNIVQKILELKLNLNQNIYSYILNSIMLLR